MDKQDQRGEQEDQLSWSKEQSYNLDDWLIDATIEQLQAAMKKGNLSAYELTLWYIKRIARYDSDGPKLNTVLELNPEALHIAAALDAERNIQGPRGPLHGIPILLKDNIDTGDKMHTSAGSLALADHYADEDAFIVKQLRQAGAIILGKVNMTEWAGFMTRNNPNGFSSRGGQVLNPYGPGKLDVGGSSSGSGAAVAANLATAAIGTETSGSIIHPSSRNSVVGIKPTVGLLSRSGIIPLALSQDTAGPMARTVTDATILLSAMIGVDEQDPSTFTSIHLKQTDYTKYLDPDGLRGARIGIPRDSYKQLTEDQTQIMACAIQKLKEEGAVIIDPVPLNSANDRWDILVLLYELKTGLNAYLQRLRPHLPVHSLRDVIEFNRQHSESTLQFGQVLLEESEATSGTLTEAEYIWSRARDLHLSQTEGIDWVMKQYQLEALLFPANFGARMAAKAGYPSINVPGGYLSTGEPFGITFTSMAYQEPKLIQLAYAYEQATKHRKPPIL